MSIIVRDSPSGNFEVSRFVHEHRREFKNVVRFDMGPVPELIIADSLRGRLISHQYRDMTGAFS